MKLSPKYSSRVLHQRSDAQSPSRSPGIHGGLQVPDFNLPIVGSTDDPLAVEPDAADQLLVTLQDPETGPALDVPEPDGVVGAAADDQPVVVLQAGDASLVAVQGSHKLARAGGPDLTRAELEMKQKPPTGNRLTLMVRSPLAETMYFSSKSTTLTAALEHQIT